MVSYLLCCFCNKLVVLSFMKQKTYKTQVLACFVTIEESGIYQISNDASFPVSFGLIPDHHHEHYGPLSPQEEARQALSNMNYRTDWKKCTIFKLSHYF